MPKPVEGFPGFFEVDYYHDPCMKGDFAFYRESYKERIADAIAGAHYPGCIPENVGRFAVDILRNIGYEENEVIIIRWIRPKPRLLQNPITSEPAPLP